MSALNVTYYFNMLLPPSETQRTLTYTKQPLA